MHDSSRLLGVWVLSMAASLTAQQTWVVDASGGPGSHFTDLPPAEAAAANGDTILVRQGRYSGFTTSKALRVLGEGGVTVGLRLYIFPSIEVIGLPAGRQFVAANLRTEGIGRGAIDTAQEHTR